MPNSLKQTVFLLLLWFSLTGTAVAAPPKQGPPPERTSPPLSTPQLIDAALQRGDIDPDTARLYLAYALADVARLPAEYRGTAPWDGTLPLLQLQAAVKTMTPGPAKTTVRQLLGGVCGSSSGSLPNTADSPNFHVEYGTIYGGLSITDYTGSLETAWQTEVDSFGWAVPPVKTANPPPGNRYHVRIDSLGNGLYGYVTISGAHAGFVGDNPNTGWNEGDAYASCMVLNRDYTAFPGSPRQALDATTAHEFNHSIQFGLGALNGSNSPDQSFIEGGATWMEDEVFDTANDNYNYLWPRFNICMGEYTKSPYPYWITFRGMTEPYGTGVGGGGEQIMQDFWEAISQNSSSQLTALDNALAARGTTLADAYHAYAIAVKFNKTCGGGYSYPYCFEEGSAYVTAAGPTPVHGTIAAVGSSYAGSVADNYTLNWVSLPTGSARYDITLNNTGGGGKLRASVVCDTGSTLVVTPLPEVVTAGQTTNLSSFAPSGCAGVVAVITNQARTGSDPTFCSTHPYRLQTSNTKTWTGNLSADWHTAGNWTPAGVPGISHSAIIPPAARRPRLNAAAQVNNLTVQSGAGLNLAAHTLTIEEVISNSGTLTQTQTVTPGATARFLRLANSGGSAVQYRGLTITPTLSASGTLNAARAITVSVAGNQLCPGLISGVTRCFELDGTWPDSATVRFYFTAAERGSHTLNQLLVYRRDGSDWLAEPGPYLRGGSGGAEYVEVSTVRQGGTFAVSPFLAPAIRRQPATLTAVLTQNLTATLALTITNGGTGPLNWSLTETPPAAWLSETPAGGVVPPSGSEPVQIRLDASTVNSGTYTTSLHITSNDSATGLLTVPVTLTVTEPPPQLAWDTQIAVNGVITGGGGTLIIAPNDALKITGRVWITHTRSLTFTLVESWTTPLSLTGWPTGSLVTGSNRAEWPVPAALPNRWHTLTKTFTVISGSFSAARITETLRPEGLLPQQRVFELLYSLPGGRPTIVAANNAIEAAITTTTAAPTATLTFSNTGIYPLNWSLTETPTVTWLSETPTGGWLAIGARQLVSVAFDSPGPGAGRYTTTLRLASNDPNRSVITIPVTLTVYPPPVYLPLALKP